MGEGIEFSFGLSSVWYFSHIWRPAFSTAVQINSLWVWSNWLVLRKDESWRGSEWKLSLWQGRLQMGILNPEPCLPESLRKRILPCFSLSLLHLVIVNFSHCLIFIIKPFCRITEAYVLKEEREIQCLCKWQKMKIQMHKRNKKILTIA